MFHGDMGIELIKVSFVGIVSIPVEGWRKWGASVNCFAVKLNIDLSFAYDG